MLIELHIDHEELKKLQAIGNFKGEDKNAIAETIHDIIYQRFEEWENFDRLLDESEEV